MHKEEIQAEALSKEVNGQSMANYGPIFSGFMARGIPEDQIKPRINVFTYNAWKALGRQVRKGEHGVRVVTFVKATRRDKATGKEETYSRPWSTTVFHFGGYAEKWHECPFDTEEEALAFLKALQTCDPQFVTTATAWGEGKERDLAGARSVAVWPEATDEDLIAPGLEDRLKARLSKLLEDFRAAVESFGFTY